MAYYQLTKIINVKGHKLHQIDENIEEQLDSLTGTIYNNIFIRSISPDFELFVLPMNRNSVNSDVSFEVKFTAFGDLPKIGDEIEAIVQNSKLFLAKNETMRIILDRQDIADNCIKMRKNDRIRCIILNIESSLKYYKIYAKFFKENEE